MKPDRNEIRVMVNKALNASSCPPSEKIDAFVRILDTFSVNELVNIADVLRMIVEDSL